MEKLCIETRRSMEMERNVMMMMMPELVKEEFFSSDLQFVGERFSRDFLAGSNFEIDVNLRLLAILALDVHGTCTMNSGLTMKLHAILCFNNNKFFDQLNYTNSLLNDC